MVTNPRAKTRADQLRPLNRPRPVTVLVEDDRPVVLVANGQRLRVVEVQDSWRIDDEWWRQPISRRYYQLVLANGTLRTVYHDLVDGTWHEQAY